MIVLSTAGMPLVEIKTWEDVNTRPKYKSKIDPLTVTLEQIIGQYFLEPQHCGIKSCNRSHNRGYLVSCSGGVETNIGKDCGFKYFGVKFQEMEGQFNRDFNAKRHREALSVFRSQLDGWEKTISFLRDGDKQGLWCVDAVHHHATKAHSAPILASLASRAKRGDGEIYREEMLDSEEWEVERQAGGKSRYRQVFVGRINGIGALSSYKRLKTLLQKHLGTSVEAFRELDIDSLEIQDLAYWDRWSKGMEGRINEVREIITDCNRYLTPANLAKVLAYRNLL